MNRHFFNFIAQFNAAAKSGKWTFVVPLRNKFTYVFINYLFREKFIEDYRFTERTPDLTFNSGVKLGSSASKKFYYPLEIRLKHDLVTYIKSVSTPGKYYFKTGKQLREYCINGGGRAGAVICSSARFGGLCGGRELGALNEGGLIVCVVHFSRGRAKGL